MPDEIADASFIQVRAPKSFALPYLLLLGRFKCFVEVSPYITSSIEVIF